MRGSIHPYEGACIWINADDIGILSQKDCIRMGMTADDVGIEFILTPGMVRDLINLLKIAEEQRYRRVKVQGL